MTRQNNDNSRTTASIPLFRIGKQTSPKEGSVNTKVVQLTTEEFSLIVGSLLGDAHIQKRKGSYRLKFTHGATQKAYLTWKYNKLRRFCTTTQGPTSAVDKKGYETFTFYTSSGQWLEPIHRLFYENVDGKYVKKVTQKLIDSLPMHPMVLGTWYMDDGSIRNDCYAGKIATQGFTKEENEQLFKYLNKWGILVKVVKHIEKKNQYYISIPASSFGKLVEVIEPIVREIPVMVYKLNDSNKTP
ncbi:LAGLIDADG DNA endonuclease family protein [Piscirickettsia salmonis LF-89 = ATCC VR-1361]|nr:LAGLIDADG DNA endonuclease family protein [Piscirickettsia salmonis LF-89 = ATCC VR-1361]